MICNKVYLCNINLSPLETGEAATERAPAHIPTLQLETTMPNGDERVI